MKQCPGCHSDHFTVQAEISSEALIAGYRKSDLVDDVARLFTQPLRNIPLLKCQNCDLRWYADAPIGDAAFYEALQRHDWYYQATKPEYAFAAAHVPAGSAVLEVGCGQGAFAAHLTSCSYRGLEFNERAVQEAQALGLNVENRDLAEEARDKPGGYDVVCHFQVLEHVPAPRKFMESCVAALRPGGLLILAVPSEDSFLHLAEECWLNMPPHHLTRWSDQALQCLVRTIGLEPIETWHEPVASYHLDWHRTVVIGAGLKALFGSRPQLVASREPGVVARMVARSKTLSHLFFRYGMARYPEAARGQSICVVAGKPS